MLFKAIAEYRSCKKIRKANPLNYDGDETLMEDCYLDRFGSRMFEEVPI